MDELWNSIISNQIKSVDEFIRDLPESYKENYTLIYKTEALGQASFDAPRILSFGENAESLISIGTIPSDPNYFNVEVLAENHQTKKWESWVFQFDSHEKSLPKKMGPNPDQCLNCHAHGGTPIWGAHPQWNGVYGSWADLPKNPVTGDIEQKNIEKNKTEKWANDNRLGFFIDASTVKDQSPMFPYRSSTEEIHNNLNFMPNMRLSFLLSLRQAKSLAKILEKKFLLDNLDIWVKYAYCGPSYSLHARKVLAKKSSDLSPQDQEILQKYLASVSAKKDEFVIQFLLTRSSPEMWSLEKLGSNRNLPYFEGLSGIHKLFTNFIIPEINDERFKFEKVSFIKWLEGQHLILGDTIKVLANSNIVNFVDSEYSFYLLQNASAVCASLK